MAKLGDLTWTCPACGEGCAVHLNLRTGVSAYDVTGRQTVLIYPDSSGVVSHMGTCQGFQARIMAGESQDVLLIDGAGTMFNVGTVSWTDEVEDEAPAPTAPADPPA